MKDSTNLLTDFDLCLALAQKAINSQMTYAWKAWKRRKQFSDTLSLYPKKDDGTPSKFGLTAVISPLEVSLNVKDGKLGQVKVTLTLASGNVHYYDEDREEAADQAISNWSVSFITDLDKKPVDLAALAQIDSDAHDVAAQLIAGSGLPDSVFAIEYLFMKLTEVDLLLSDNKNVNIPDGVNASARTKALSSLNHLLQGDMGEFMLGTVVRRNTLHAAPTFAMTDFVFDVHANWTNADAATLSYLGVFAGRSLPNDINAARIELAGDWVSPGMIDGSDALVSGIMAIRKEVFLDQYLMPQFTQVLGVNPTVNGLKRRFAVQNTQSHTSRDLVDRKVEDTRGYWLEIAIVPGSNAMSIAGSIDGSFTYTEHTLGPAGMETARLEGSGSKAISGSVALSTPGGTSAFSVDAKLNYGFGDLLSHEDAGGFGKVENAMSWIPKLLGINKGTLLEMLGEIVSDNVNALNAALQRALGHIAVDMSHHHFIPPGGGVFTFQNLRFSDQTGDMMLDVIYKAP
ncbi:hypothetical protein GZH47_00270 [Paenibacillus rhizovicinus]|uniref:Uncharacterized protein n=1 Tax=Paenibacillus rhizovicinus TaxID=2704463 RepID=A0A6C0NTC8_9BACL|nr:hypothetical protein [Paenibacillus rhizovicinus]QHW29415.1 hypothetical protein GZH47_00270 [Paenibacillus rhizovicinus]